jgi:methyl-accepting chemotaxis protein
VDDLFDQCWAYIHHSASQYLFARHRPIIQRVIVLAQFFRNASIKKKLMLSMAACLLLFLGISTTLSVTMSGRDLRKRAVEQELPAVVGEIRNDIRQQIAQPLATSVGIANNAFLLDWEASGGAQEGEAAWQAYAKRLKHASNAATVFWASNTSHKFFTENGYERTLDPSAVRDRWLPEFLASGKPYELNLDRDVGTNVMMLFINTRVDAGPGKLGVAGLGLKVDTLAEAVRAYKVGKNGSVALVRADGVVLVHRDPALADGKHYLKDLPGFNAELSARMLGGAKFAYASYDAGSGAHIVATSFVPELNVYVVAQLAESEILGDLARSSTIGAVVAGLVGGCVGLFVIFLVSRAIAAPVARAAGMLGEIADGRGDLTRRMPVESGDEVGALAAAFNRFLGSLNNTITEVRDSTHAIGGASSEIAAGNMNLSARTEAQASSLEETAAAMEELTSTVRQNADNARQANQLAMSASAQASQGGQVVHQVVATMGAIADSSRKIEDIISVIDGIAFQTNILALNAAVEAARAGDQGRGFAVVASEVRSLAQRSAEAAKQIKVLITDSVEKVETGGRLVDAAGDAMTGIVGEVQRVADLMSEIAAASNEQSQGIGQVNQSIADMDDATQQNAALVEEAAAAAASLQEQSMRLSQVVAVFKLDETASVAPVAAGRAVPPAPAATVRVQTRRPALAGARHQGDDWEQF